MRILALETSSERGSIALLEGEESRDASLASYRAHFDPKRHAESMLRLADDALKEAGWERQSIDRIAVGVGPGSFTGVRIAIAQAQGLMLGLSVVGVGVGSLRIVAAGHDASDPRLRVVLRDARRDEFFLAAYDVTGREVLAPHAIPQNDAYRVVQERFGNEKIVVLGTEVEGLPCELGEETTEPDARPLARIALTLDPHESPVSPCYVRGPNIVRPKLPPSPLLLPKT